MVKDQKQIKYPDTGQNHKTIKPTASTVKKSVWAQIKALPLSFKLTFLAAIVSLILSEVGLAVEAIGLGILTFISLVTDLIVNYDKYKQSSD